MVEIRNTYNFLEEQKVYKKISFEASDIALEYTFNLNLKIKGSNTESLFIEQPVSL